MRLAIRGFKARELVFEERVTKTIEELDTLLPKLAETHANAMAAGDLTMIEIEFVDDPNPNERFFRIGTDPRGMVMPIEIEL